MTKKEKRNELKRLAEAQVITEEEMRKNTRDFIIMGTTFSIVLLVVIVCGLWFGI